MNLHPHGSRRFLVALLLAFMALSSCSVLPAKPDLPDDQFPAAPDRDPHISSQASALACDGAEVVAVGTVTGRIRMPGFWYSADHGSSWQVAALSEAAEAQSLPSDSVWGPAAVSGTGEQRRWLVLGRDHDQLLAWTSADGKIWERNEASGMNPDIDSVAKIIRVDDGFLAVGFSRAVSTEKTEPSVWRSIDGITWSGETLSAFNSAGLSDVASNGQTVVAVGWDELNAKDPAGRLQYATVLVSDDGGQTWEQAAFPEPADSLLFNTRLSDVVHTPYGFMAGGSYFNRAGSYRSWLLRSTDGHIWEPGPAAPITGVRDGVSDILVTDSAVTLLQSSRPTADSQTMVFSTLNEQGSFGKVNRLPGLPTDSRYWLAAATTSGQALLLSVDSDDERWSGQLWSSGQTGQWGKLSLPAPPTMRADVSPRQLFLHDDQLSVWGGIQGAWGRWEQRADGGFNEPLIVRDEPRDSLWGAFAGGGGWLVLGSSHGEAQVLASSDTNAWHVSGPGTFNEVDMYHSSLLLDAVWAQDRWVVVGMRTTNGLVRQHALIFSSTDGVTWVPGSSASIYQTGDCFSASDVATDLDGLENKGRFARAIAAVPSGLLVVGNTDGESGMQPVYWQSSDKQTWQMQPLTSEGLTNTYAYGIEAQGDRVVIYGTGWDDQVDDWRPVLWASGDGGASFTQGTLGDIGENGGVSFSSSQFGFTAVVTADDRAGAALWRSQDGLNWTSEPIEFPESGRPYQIAVNSTLERDGKLLILAELSNRTDASTVLLEVPLS